MKLLLLAAGYATRLWPITLRTPKPLLKIGPKPMIEHILEKFDSLDNIDDIFIITNSTFTKDFKAWKNRDKRYSNISIVDDGVDNVDDRRGSIGDIIFTVEKKRIKSDIVVVAGDNIFDFEIKNFIKTAKRNAPFITIGLYDIKNLILARRYGIVQLDKGNRVIAFEEKPSRPRSTLAAMCLYYFPKDKLTMLKKYQKEGNPLDLAGNFIRWLSKKEAVYGYVFHGKWLDIGDKSSFGQAQGILWN